MGSTNATQIHCVSVDPRLHQPCSIDETQYGFIPVLSAGVVFVVLFSLASAALLPQGFVRWPRGRFMISASVCAVAEIAGWAFRVQGHYRPFASWSYIAQMVILIIAPVFLSASNYIGLDHIQACVGYEMARFRKRVYLTAFLTLDIASLVVQAVGGASAAGSGNSGSSSGNSGKTGMYIALGGVGLQVAATVLYLVLLVDFLHRHRRTYLREQNMHTVPTNTQSVFPLTAASIAPSESERTYKGDPSQEQFISYGRWTRGSRQFCGALFFASLCLLVRCIYRALEMSGFSNEYLFTHEWYLCVFDGVPIFFALTAVAIFHPSRVLPPPWTKRQPELEQEKEGYP